MFYVRRIRKVGESLRFLKTGEKWVFKSESCISVPFAHADRCFERKITIKSAHFK